MFEAVSSFEPSLNLITGCLLFVGILLVALPAVGAINRMDIEALQLMFQSTEFISKFVDIPLIIMQRILDQLLKT